MAGPTKLKFMISSLILVATVRDTVQDDKVCAHPLGLTSNAIEDWQLTASSVKSDDADCAVKFARLHMKSSKAWCAKTRDKGEQEWLMVDLGVRSKVTGLVLQGRNEVDEWVTNFMVSYSDDAYQWDVARDIYGNRKVFRGNSDAYSLRHSYLEHPIEARFILIHVAGYHNHPSMRLEIIGCQECNSILSVEPFTEMSASSFKRWNPRRRRRHSKIGGKTCLPNMGIIDSAKGWCPRKQNDHQWLQFDLGPATTVTGLMTKGQGDKKRFVTSYTMSYSNDSSVWFFYKDANHLEAKVFGGNMDTETERRHYLNQPVVARFVRIHPQTWHKRIGLRAAVIGCPAKHGCHLEQGLMQVNHGSACIANKAFNKDTWVNDKRHMWKEWRYGHSSLAVDGDVDDSLHNCAILDNYYEEFPVWMVDLGSDQVINGIVITTWQGKGQDKITSYTDYAHNLDRLTVYTSRRKHLGDNRALAKTFLGHDRKCASISRRNNAVFNPRLHFECPEPRRGRYVYVKATGVPDRWKKTFNVVLCEVQVY